MPSPKSFLRQLAEQNLNPKKAYTKSDFDKDGKLKQKQVVEMQLEAKVEEVKSEDTLLDSETSKKEQLTDVEKITMSAAASNSKSQKSTKKETTVSQKIGETVSVKNTDKKESVKTEPASKERTDTDE